MIAFFIGMAMIGCVSYRMQYILGGKVAIVNGLNMLITVAYWFQVKYIVNSDIGGYLAFSLGACLITAFQAYQNKKRLVNE